METSKQQFELATRRIQVELDALGHLQKLRTSEEFEAVKELWKRMSALGVALERLPSLGFAFVSADDEQREKDEKQAYSGFFTRFDEARDFIIESVFSTPQNIKEAAEGLLKIANSQRFDMVSSKTTIVLYELRQSTTKHQKEYRAKLDELLNLMRQFKQGQSHQTARGQDEPEQSVGI